MVRTWIIALCLCAFSFVFPLQFFIIGNGTGMGIQGAVYRYQITTAGNSLILITNEISYVTSGLYTGKTALSVIFWVLGTLILVTTTAYALIYGSGIAQKHILIITFSLAGASIGYLASCVAQYGPMLNGPAGISIPFGVLVLVAFALLVYYYRRYFFTI